MRRGNTDRNQQEIVDSLRAVGALVHDTHMVGDGFPDVVVRFRNEIHLMEIKNADSGSSARVLSMLTEEQRTFHARWRGPGLHIVTSPNDALRAIGVM